MASGGALSTGAVLSTAGKPREVFRHSHVLTPILPSTHTQGGRWHSGISAVGTSLVAGFVLARRLRLRPARWAPSRGEIISLAVVDASRVLAVVGKDGVGKSKVCAALLDLAENSSRLGDANFADKKRLLETERAEVSRNFSCYSHIYSQRSDGKKTLPHLHLIDTPGHVDRLPLVDGSLNVANGAIVVCSVNSGVDAACGRIFASVEKSKKPSVIFLNGVDTEDGAPGFTRALDDLERRLGVRPVVLFAPAHIGGPTAETGSFLLNVLKSTLCSTEGCELDPIVSNVGKHQKKRKPTTSATPELIKWAMQLREQLVESLASVDEELMETYMELDGDVPRAQIDAALQRAAATGKVSPLVAGSAKTGIGIDALQEVVQTFIPSGISESDKNALGIDSLSSDLSAESPCLGWAFQERRVGEDRFLEVRVLGGALRPKETLRLVGIAGAVKEISTSPERCLVHGLRGELKAVEVAGPGDIVLVPALDLSVAVAAPLREALELGGARRGRCTFALHLDDMASEKREALLQAVGVLIKENDGLRLERNEETGEMLLSCMGMLHLALLKERLADDFGIKELPLGEPHVAYHLTLKSTSRVDEPAPKSAESWAHVELTPATPGDGIRFVDKLAELDPTRGGKVAQEVAGKLEHGLRSALEKAGPGGIPVVDVTVELLDACARTEEEALAATREAIQKAVSGATVDMELLEPIVELEVDSPTSAIGAVLADLRERRGELIDTRPSEGEDQVLTAEVPLREILSYTQDLEALTAAEGFFTYRVQGYRPVTSHLRKRILAELLDA